MASLFIGHQLHSFFQDPAYWGQGQSFRNLRLMIDGRQIGPEDFASGWDTSDIPADAQVEILAGTWEAPGLSLPSHDMPSVADCWKRGLRPIPLPDPQADPCILAAPTLPRPAFMRKPVDTAVVPEPVRVKRPVFVA